MALLDQLEHTARRIYERVFERGADEQVRATMKTLAQVPTFEHLERRTLRELAASVHERTYARDEHLYYEGDPGLGLYVIQRGSVRLVTEDDAGEVQELRQVGAHEVFGDVCVIGDFRRLETAQAMTETAVLGFFRPDLRTMMKRHPEAGADVTAVLARHLVARQMEVMRLVAEVDGKVAALRMLEGAALRAGAPSPGGPSPARP